MPSESLQFPRIYLLGNSVNSLIVLITLVGYLGEEGNAYMDGRHLRVDRHDGWHGYMEMEREQLAQRADGKMARMLGRALPGESQEELDLISSEDQFLAQAGYRLLKHGDKVWAKHIEDMSREDRHARIEYEKELVRWLKSRVERLKTG
jgi:uncharacterized protein YceH (UPF0502 family)